MKTLLFLCTGNYYRSRFAEYYFRHLCPLRGLPWRVDSRGLQLDHRNPGPLSAHTRHECLRLQIEVGPERMPLPLELGDLEAADLVVAVKETEHRPLMRRKFPDWEERIEYWEVHDIDCAPPHVALPQLRLRVEELADRLASAPRPV